MKKKIRDCSLDELNSICETSTSCQRCPLFFENEEFGYEECFMAYRYCASDDLLDREDLDMATKAKARECFLAYPSCVPNYMLEKEVDISIQDRECLLASRNIFSDTRKTYEKRPYYEGSSDVCSEAKKLDNFGKKDEEES